MGLGNYITKLVERFSPVAISMERYTLKELLVMRDSGYKVEEVQKYITLYEKGTHPKQIKSAKRLENKRIREQLTRLRFEDISALDITLADVPNPTNLGKLQRFLSVSISPDMELIKKSLKDQRISKEDFINSKIMLTSIVQSAPAFWDSKEGVSYAAFVLTYVREGRFKNNPEFLKLISKLLNDFRDLEVCPNGISDKMKVLYQDLNNPMSEFNIELDQSLLDYYALAFKGSRVKAESIVLATSYKTQSEKNLLPNSCFPSDGILPLICLNALNKKGENHPYYKFIASEYYS